MKKIVFSVLSILVLVGCKNETSKTENDSVDTKIAASDSGIVVVYRGEFIYTDEAAVLMGKDFIYGVTINDKAKELGEKVAPIKTEENDMVPVVVSGTLIDKPAGKETWDKFITITNIIEVSKTPSKADIKIEDKKVEKK
ncbi:hypothetical protein [Patiriisocius sp. Uisw_017]|jgi:hypothetical protein|uniref:hypothetical protein n=1 Tax=Patiriisocius sp. Uisw_017 TaxID=3230968 RepID=UPI0039EBD9A6